MVVVRERSIPELYDLALMVTRRHAIRLLALTAVGAVPMSLFDYWLLKGSGWGSLYPLLILLCAQAPLVTAPVTAYLGEAMFASRASARSALRAAARRWQALILVGILRGLYALVPILLIFFPPHLVEVLLLERQSFKAAWKRAPAMTADWKSEGMVHACLGPVVVAAGVTVGVWAGSAFVHVLVWGLSAYEDILPLLDPGTSPLPSILVWPIVTYLAVVRFLAYIDLRTRHEGWDVELQLRRAARRLEPDAEAA